MGENKPAPHAKQDLSNIIGWFHPKVDRHIADTLLNANGEEGTYLLRPSSKPPGSLALSLRTKDAVKHFNVEWDGREYTFGLGKFPTLETFLAHFEGQPMIAGENGVLTALRYPYPSSVEESPVYDSATTHEGFLTKQGGKIKNWKTRWFVMKNNTISYFKDRNSEKAIKVLDLTTCFGCDMDKDHGKQHCFKLMFPERVFFMYSSSAAETKEWLDKIKWKLNAIKSSK